MKSRRRKQKPDRSLPMFAMLPRLHASASSASRSTSAASTSRRRSSARSLDAAALAGVIDLPLEHRSATSKAPTVHEPQHARGDQRIRRSGCAQPEGDDHARRARNTIFLQVLGIKRRCHRRSPGRRQQTSAREPAARCDGPARRHRDDAQRLHRGAGHDADREPEDRPNVCPIGLTRNAAKRLCRCARAGRRPAAGDKDRLPLVPRLLRRRPTSIHGTSPTTRSTRRGTRCGAA